MRIGSLFENNLVNQNFHIPSNRVLTKGYGLAGTSFPNSPSLAG